MTSQVNSKTSITAVRIPADCRPSASAPKDYCRNLKHGIARLEAAIRQEYEAAFPAGGDWIARALREVREGAWRTPFPSLFFPALAHLRVSETMPRPNSKQ